MHDILNVWAGKLRHAVLPALPHTIQDLKHLIHNEQARTWQLANVAEKDPGLCVALLRKVNSGRQNRLYSEINTIEKAMMMLGMTQVQSLLNAVPLFPAFADDDPRQNAIRLMAQSYHAAWQARNLARLRKDLEPDEVFLVTLIHQLGEVLLWLYAPDKMQELETFARQQKIQLQQAQSAVLGFGLNHLSLMLARHWQLPSLLRDSLKSENASLARPYGIMLAVQLARAVENGWYKADVTVVFKEITKLTGYDFATVSRECHQTAVAAARSARICPVLPAAARLLYPAEKEADPDGAELLPGNELTETATMDLAAAEPHGNKKDAGTVRFCLAPQLHILRHSLQNLQTGMQAGHLSYQNILSLLMDAMHDGMALERVVFALFNPQQQRIHARAIAGADHDPVFSRFNIDLNGAHLFTQLMQKPQALWINDTNRDKFWPLVPVDFQRIIRCNSFFVMSIFIAEKPVGLLYADRGAQADCTLDTHAYHRFKQTGLLAAKAMAIQSGTVHSG